MKKIFLTIFCFPLLLHAQESLIVNYSDCGTWEKDTTYEIISSIDTIKYIPWGFSLPWTYSDWIDQHNGETLAVYCPCGCRHEKIEAADRVNERGIRQRMLRITVYKYIPKPETEYQRKLKQLQSK